jgi:hypothetical protein
MPPKNKKAKEVNPNKLEGTILNKSDIKRLRMVYFTDENFEKTDSKKLYDVLSDKYPLSSLNVICYALKKLFTENEEEDKAKFWLEKGAESGKALKDQEAENKLTGSEKQKWKSQEQIMKIMSSIKIVSWTDRNRFMILAMCTYQPPLRKGVYNRMKFLFNPKKNNKKDNYLFLIKDGVSYFIVNNDKVTRHDSFNTPESIFIQIEDKNLVKALWTFYEIRKREYVFVKENGDPYSMDSFTKLLLEEPYDLSFNILRSSYVTHFYNTHNNFKDRTELARKMRNSAQVGHLNYYKDI